MKVANRIFEALPVGTTVKTSEIKRAVPDVSSQTVVNTLNRLSRRGDLKKLTTGLYLRDSEHRKPRLRKANSTVIVAPTVASLTDAKDQMLVIAEFIERLEKLPEITLEEREHFTEIEKENAHLKRKLEQVRGII